MAIGSPKSGITPTKAINHEAFCFFGATRFFCGTAVERRNSIFAGVLGGMVQS